MRSCNGWLSSRAHPARPAPQLTLLQKLVQQSAAAGDVSPFGSLTPLASPPDSLRTSAAPSTTAAAGATPLRSSMPLPVPQGVVQSPASRAGEQQEEAVQQQAQADGRTRAEQPAEQHWGLVRAVDCFRCGLGAVLWACLLSCPPLHVRNAVLLACAAHPHCCLPLLALVSSQGGRDACGCEQSSLDGALHK